MKPALAALEDVGNEVYHRLRQLGGAPSVETVHHVALSQMLRRHPHPASLGPLYESFLEWRPVLDPVTSPERPYQLLRDSRHRQATGSYFTPTPVIAFLVEQTLGPLLRNRHGDLTSAEISELRILDPAVGAGCFLVAAADFLARAYAAALQREGTAGRDWLACRQCLVERCLFGVDVDPLAVELTRLALAHLTAEPERVAAILGQHVRQGDALGEATPAIDWERDFRDRTGRTDFDAVLGNPPWGRCRPTSTLRARFPTFQPRHANLSVPFTELSLELSEKGRVGMVLPAAWLEIDSCRRLRQRLFGTRRIETLVQAHQLFARNGGPAVDAVLLVVGSRGIAERVMVYRLDTHLSVSKRLEQLSRRDWSDVQTILVSEHHKRGGALSLSRQRLPEGCVALEGEEGSYVRVRIGAQEYARGGGSPPQTAALIAERSYHASHRIDERFVRFIPCGDVQRFQLAWSGGWLRWGDNLHCPRDRAIYVREHLLLSRIFDVRRRVFKCCHVPARSDDFWCNNTDSFNVWLAEDAPVTLFALLGILGSRVLGRLASEQFVNLQRQVFPKASVRMVRSLPLPLRETFLTATGADLARQLDACVRRIVAEGLNLERERELERLVARLYGLPVEEAQTWFGSGESR